MAQRHPTIACEDVPLDEARRMSREPRMPLPVGTRLRTMKNRILRRDAQRGIPIIIRRVPRGLLLYRSTDEDLTQDKPSYRVCHPPRTPNTPLSAADAGGHHTEHPYHAGRQREDIA
jgi:hypothetical protein